MPLRVREAICFRGEGVFVRGALRDELLSSDQGGRWPRIYRVDCSLSLILGRVCGVQRLEPGGRGFAAAAALVAGLLHKSLICLVRERVGTCLR